MDAAFNKKKPSYRPRLLMALQPFDACRQRLSRLPCVRRPCELWCALMAMLVGSCLSGEARLAAGTMSSGALMSGALVLLLAVGALREGALAERAGGLPARLPRGAAVPFSGLSPLSALLPLSFLSAEVLTPAPAKVLSCLDIESFLALPADFSALGALVLLVDLAVLPASALGAAALVRGVWVAPAFLSLLSLLLAESLPAGTVSVSVCESLAVLLSRSLSKVTRAS